MIRLERNTEIGCATIHHLSLKELTVAEMLTHKGLVLTRRAPVSLRLSEFK